MANATMKGQATGRFLGVNLRADRLSLADDDLAKAINADLHTEPGTIVLRLGRIQKDFAISDLVIRRLAKINTRLYRVAGQSLYCGTTRVLNGVLSQKLMTTLTPFRPLNDTTIWAFVADDAVMRKVNCTTVQGWGFAAPPAPTSHLGFKTTFTGAYSFRVTGVRFVGSAVAHEGNPTAATTSITAVDNDLCVGDLLHSSSDVNGVGIYRTATGGAAYLLDIRVAFPTTDTTYSVTHDWEASVTQNTILFQWTYAREDASLGAVRTTFTWEQVTDLSGTHEDASGFHTTFIWGKTFSYVTTQTYRWAYATTKADTALGSALDTDNNPPPLASWGFSHQEHVFLLRDAANPHYLWYSKRFLPESVPVSQFLEIGQADDPLQCGFAFAGIAGVFSRLTKYRILGNTTSGFIHQESLSRRGTPAPSAAVATEFGVVFVARDGIFVTNFMAQDTPFAESILPLFFNETVHDFAPVNWAAASTMAMASYKNKLYWAYPSGTATSPDMLAVYSNDTKRWYFFDHPMRCLLFEEDTDDLLGGRTDGFVYILEEGNTDAGAAIMLDVETKDYAGQSKDILKLFHYLKLDADTKGEAVTVEFYLNDSLKRTLTLTTTGRQDRLLPLPAGCLGHRWRLRFRYTGNARIRLYAAAALYLPLEAA